MSCLNADSENRDTGTPEWIPGIITALHTQTRNPSRVSVFIDDVFRFGCFKSVALDCGLGTDKKLTEERYRQTMLAEQRFGLREYLLGLLSRRSHTGAELRRKALKKEAPPSLIDELVEELKTKGYINESAYALSYAEQTSARKHWGPARIRQELFKRGIDRATTEQTLDLVFSENSDEPLRELTLKNRKRFRRESDILKRRKKIFDHLSRKGHPPALILEHLDGLAELVEKSDDV